MSSGLSEKVSVFHFHVTLSCYYSIIVFRWHCFGAVLTIAVVSLPVAFRLEEEKKRKRKRDESDEDECFYVRTTTKEKDQDIDASVDECSKIYRLVQRDEKSISALQTAIDGKEFPIENIDMAHRVLALIKGDTNVEDERGAPCNLGKVNGNKSRSPRARNQVKDNEEEQDGSGARATRRSKRRVSMQDEEEDAEEEEEQEEDQEEEEEEEEEAPPHWRRRRKRNSLEISSGMHIVSSSGMHIVRYVFFEDSMTWTNSKVRFLRLQ